MTIRTAAERDVPVLAELGARTFADTYAEANDPADLDAHIAESYTEATIIDALHDPRVIYLLATSGGQAVGFAKVVVDSTEDGIDAAHPAEVNQLYVAAEMHGRGLGRALLSECVERVRGAGCDVLWLGVWEGNSKAIAFYERFGLRPVGTHEFRFGSQPQTDLLMVMSLQS